jgi:Large polyvalent protein associated domain 39
MAENRGYTPEELGLVPKAPAQRGYTPEELGLVPKKEEPKVVQKKPEDVGLLESIVPSLKRGLGGYEESGAGISLAASSVLGNEEAARKKMEAIKAENKKVEEKPGLSVADLERIYEEKGLTSAAGQVPKYITQQLLQSGPEMAGPLAVGAGVSMVATPLVGTLAGMGTYGIQQFGHFLARQAEEKKDPKELEVTKAAIAAGVTAPLGYMIDKWTAGLTSLGEKKAGEEILKELTARQIAARTGKRAVVGATEGIIAEAPLEVVEQAAERYQAGLSLTGEDAYKEYKEAFFGAAAAGGTIGAASRGVKGYREAKLENIEARKERLAEGKNTFTEGDEYESNGIDTGNDKQSVSPPSEQKIRTDETTGGAGEFNTSRLDTTNTSTEGTAGGESVQQRALKEKEDFYNWLKEHDIVPTSEKEVDMYEGMWRREQQLTGQSTTTETDETPAKKMAATSEEQKLINSIKNDEAWLRENPDDPHYQDAINIINRKRAELKALQEVAPLARVSPTKQAGFDFNAPEEPEQNIPQQVTPASPKVSFKQEGFDFGQADASTQRSIINETPSKGFELSAPSGQVLKGNGVEIIDGPPIAKLDLATESVEPVEAFINSIKPLTENEKQLKDFETNKRTILETIQDFLGTSLTYRPRLTEEEKAQGITEKPLVTEKGVDVDPDIFQRRLGVINTFFNTLSLAPEERQQKLQALRTALPGLTPQQQNKAFAEFINIPNLNTVRGIKELRNDLQEWLDKYEGALLGEGKANAVLGEGRFGIGWRKGQYVIRSGDKISLGPVMKAALDKLKSKHPDQRTPEETAAFIFFSRKSPYEQPFVFALRNAAYLFSSKESKNAPINKGETKKNAVLFRKWLEENAPDKVLDYFDSTANDYEQQFKKAEKVSEEIRKARAASKENISGKYMPWLYRAPSGRAEKFASSAGLNKYKKPSKPVVTKAEEFIELGVTGEEFGRNRDESLVLRPDLLKPDTYYPLHPAIESCIANNDLNGALEIMATSKDPYTKGVAEKFLSLGLKTSTVFDKQGPITISYLDWTYNRPNSARTRVFNFLQDMVPDLDPNVIKNPTTLEEIRTQADTLDKLLNYDLITPVKPELEQVVKFYKDILDANDNASGVYYYGIDTINFNRKFVVSNNDFIHEVAHAAADYALNENNFEKLTPKQQKAVSELKKLYKLAKDTIEGQGILDTYGLTDINEFIAEAFSNVDFQNLLKTIPYKYVTPTDVFKLTPDKKAVMGQRRVQIASPEAPTQPIERNTESLWDKFTNLISRLIGLDNVLGHTLANANIILQAIPSVEYSSSVANAIVHASKGKPNTMALKGTRQTAPPRQGYIDRVFSGRPEWEAVKASMPIWLESLSDSLRKHYLGAFTLRQLDDMVGRKLPPFTEFIKNVENMLDARNSVLAETKDVILPWQKFQEKHSELAKTLNKLMIDATVETIDPSKFTSTNYYGMGSLDAFNALSKADREKRKVLDKAYKDIGPDGQKIYKDVKDFYAKRLAAYKASLLNRIKDVLISEGIKEADVKNHPSYKKIEEYFRRHTLEPYFPLKRFGDYWLVINKTKGQAKEYYQFESALERNLFATKRKEEIKHMTGNYPEIDMGNSLRDTKWKGSIKDLEFLKELKDLVRTGEGNDVKTLKGNLEESLEQLYLLQLPDQNVRKMFLPRQGTAGMDQDMLRAFSSSAFHMAYQHSRFEFGPKLFNSVKQADSFLSDMNDPKEEKKLRDYIGELSKRVDFIMNPPDTGTIPSFLSNLSFIWYMTAPASALVNMLGVVAVGQPVLATRFGQAQTAKTMLGYAKRVGASGFKDQDGNWSFPSITKDANLTDAQKAAVKRFIADGLFDITLSHDIVGLAESSSNLYTGRSKKIMGVLSAAFHGAEKFNREVVAMSAFDMAMKKYAKPENGGYKGDKLFEKAVEVTKDLTYKSMFDYSTLNKPRFFQSKWAKVMLQFKQFSQQMTYLIARSAYEGFWGVYNYDKLIKKEQRLGPNKQLPELQDVRQQINAIQRQNGEPEYQGAGLEEQVKKYYKDLRNEGRNRLYGTVGMTFAFAGVTGLPGWWAATKLIEALHSVFGDDDDEDKPFDFNNWFKNWTAENFGGFWGDSISRGIMSQVSGVNIADRMGLSDLWFRDPRASKDETEALQNFLIGMMGPSVGLAISATDALKQMHEGHLERAMETISPAILKDLLKAGRFSETFGDGKATTLKGDVLIDDFGVGEVAAQAIGFSSERLAQKQKANIEMKTAEQQILLRRQALLNAYFMGIDNNDSELLDRTLDKIIKFNTANPGAGILPANLSKSVINRYRQRALGQVTGGMNIQKKLIGELGGMSAYGDE